MDCNREEAIRAKEIAEKKMQNNDFEGARKIALKAQTLFPELDNISQLLTVCDVHCSATNKTYGSEKNWYSILQVEKLADDATIRKQYRKLALTLHPDKNKFPGAEAAFKLIGEANVVLSDQEKRSLYDAKCRFSVRPAYTKLPPHQVNRNHYAWKENGVKNNTNPNVSGAKFGGFNYQPTQPDMSNGRPAFWTCCPFCNIKYQYYRDFVNRALNCPKCCRLFIAYDLGAQGVNRGSSSCQPGAPGVPLGSTTWNKPPFSQETQFPSKAAQNAGAFPSSQPGLSKTVGTESLPRAATTSNVGVSQTKAKEGGHSNEVGGKQGGAIPKVDEVKRKESSPSRNTSRKRGRKMVVESSESCETESGSEDVTMQESKGTHVQDSGFNGDQHPRRSSRQRRHVSYNESAKDDDDDDFVSPPKRSRLRKGPAGKDESKISGSNGFPGAVKKDNEEVKQKESTPPGESMPNRNSEPGKQSSGEAAATVDLDAENTIVIDDSSTSSSSISASEPNFCDCPDPEFNDFDKDKKEECFAVGQIWACYDTVDGMPRFYALVEKVSPGFKLLITWLEAAPEDAGEIDWVNSVLPIACGKFVCGEPQVTSDRLTFSHLVHWEEGEDSDSYLIYPRKGQIWALFNGWNIDWCSDPKSYAKNKYDIVEVLSDFTKGAGTKVACLEKVKGFVSLFQRSTSFFITPSELLRFSHQIPYFKMSGTEREGVPQGSFELDPDSLPTNPDDLCQPVEANMEAESKETTKINDCPDPEFNDFGKDKKEECFAAGQIWACYDTLEGMPRFYALVEKVSPGFKLQITWLEAAPEDAGEIDWVNAVLPIACGKFVCGEPQETSDRLTFSHLVHWEKGKDSHSYLIHPRKGQIWALFNGWNIDWCSDPKFHAKNKYDIVEVLSDFTKGAGTKVACLEKVKGFVSLFQRSTSFVITPSELLRFSHRIPYFKMSGTEREGVPQGSFELDPDSLPTNPDDLCHPVEANMEAESKEATKINDFPPKNPNNLGSEKICTPKKSVDIKGMNNIDGKTLKTRRSPRQLNSNPFSSATKMAPAKDVNGTDATPSKANTSLSGANVETPLSRKNSSSSSRLPSTSSLASRVSDEVFHNFSGVRYIGKFQLGQVWAMYNIKDGLPKTYVQIKKIESSRCRLHVALLEACSVNNDKTQPISCGKFKLQYGKTSVFPLSSFSHVVKAESIGKSIFEIYPRVGEIWALFKGGNPDMEKRKYEIVEVVEDGKQCLKVTCLVRFSGYRSVFKAPRRLRSSAGILEVPRREIARFSHQIPAFQLTVEKDGFLKGFWELDSASLPDGEQHPKISDDERSEMTNEQSDGEEDDRRTNKATKMEYERSDEEDDERSEEEAT